MKSMINVKDKRIHSILKLMKICLVGFFIAYSVMIFAQLRDFITESSWSWLNLSNLIVGIPTYILLMICYNNLKQQLAAVKKVVVKKAAVKKVAAKKKVKK